MKQAKSESNFMGNGERRNASAAMANPDMATSTRKM
jgi:hypothetical protein